MYLETTPNHWSASQFEGHPGMSVDDEFTHVAALAIYFHAMCTTQKAARVALSKLRSTKHPIAMQGSANELLKATVIPAGITARYNQLVMQIASEFEDLNPYIDEYGAFGFRIGQDSNVAMGNASGLFALYNDPELLRHRFEQAEDDALAAQD